MLLTPSQTVGPFFQILVPVQGRTTLTTDKTPGQRIVIEGCMRDGAGAPVLEGLVEVWQADAAGRLNHPEDPRSEGPDRTFDGFGRVHTDAEGRFAIETIKPGSVPGPGGQSQAPHLVIGVFARGLLARLVTRIYFDDEPSNASDPVLAYVPADRRSTLIARRHDSGRYDFDIVLQGANETVFFDV